MSDVLDDFFARYEELRQVDKEIGPQGRSIQFGSPFFLYSFLKSTGLLELFVLPDLDKEETETFLALLIFYLSESDSDKYALEWYYDSLARVLFPEADLDAERVDRLLIDLGSPYIQQEFFEKWIHWLKSQNRAEKTVLEGGWIESILFAERLGWDFFHSQFRFPDFQLLFGFDLESELPLYFIEPEDLFDVSWYDATTGKNTEVWCRPDQIEDALKMGKELGLDLDLCNLMCSYTSFELLNLFYQKEYRLSKGFFTGADNYNDISEEIFAHRLYELKDPANQFTFQNTTISCLSFPIWLDAQKKNKAWFYFYCDKGYRARCLEKLEEEAKENEETVSKKELEEKLGRKGYFVYLSQNKRTPGSVLAKSEKMKEKSRGFLRFMDHELALRKQAEATFNGYLFVIFAAACIEKLLDIALKRRKWTGFRAISKLNEQQALLFDDHIEPENISFDQLRLYDLVMDYPLFQDLPLKEGQLDLSCWLSDNKELFKRKPKQSKKK